MKCRGALSLPAVRGRRARVRDDVRETHSLQEEKAIWALTSYKQKTTEDLHVKGASPELMKKNCGGEKNTQQNPQSTSLR